MHHQVCRAAAALPFWRRKSSKSDSQVKHTATEGSARNHSQTMTLCDDLPLEVMSKILALVAAKKERTDWSNDYWTEVPDANSTYLQRMAKYTLVSKKWNGLLWQNHPHKIRAMKASSPVVKLLYKIPFLSELQIPLSKSFFCSRESRNRTERSFRESATKR